MTMKTSDDRRCPNHLNRTVHLRGICKTCYQLFYGRIRRGLTTWEELEKQRLVEPTGLVRMGRPPKEMQPISKPMWLKRKSG